MPNASCRFLLFLLSLAAFLAFFIVSAFAGDCYPDCMNASNCWGPGSDRFSGSYCSGTQARCETDCRNANRESYGAIAYSTKSGAYGYSDSWENRKKAEKAAMKFCSQHGKGCDVQVWFYNSCGAVAVDGRKVGWGQNSSETAARQQAMDQCKKSGGKKCAVKTSHCSR